MVPTNDHLFSVFELGPSLGGPFWFCAFLLLFLRSGGSVPVDRQLVIIAHFTGLQHDSVDVKQSRMMTKKYCHVLLSHARQCCKLLILGKLMSLCP